MPHSSGFLVPLCAAAVLISGAAAQKAKDEPEQLGARDMFYHPVKVAPVAGETKGPVTGGPTTGGSKMGKGKSSNSSKGSPDQVASGQSPKTDSTPQNPAQTLPGGGVMMRASAPSEGPALGMKYTLVKKSKKEDTEVATDAIFHNDDQIQLKIETNLPAYLYVITLGSSGTWKVQIPSADVPEGSNRVEAMKPFSFPPRDAEGKERAFTFHDPKGAEKIFIIASREPVADIQNQIYGLKNGKGKPVAQPDPLPERQSTMVQARVDIPNDKISEMREMYSRDLIIERVNPDSAGDKVKKKEFAMYVVNPTGSKKSRLVADVTLEHQ